MRNEKYGDPVRAQYEDWVYPEPIPDLDAPGVRSTYYASEPFILGQAYWPDRPSREDLSILVAGCGPNAAARFAFHYRKARVVGIDLSASSLAHEERLKVKHGLDNLRLVRGRLEEVEEIGETFDLIECSGVLHHLPDPVAGLAALAKVLRRDGVVFLMLYAKYGRAGVYMAQEFFRLLGLNRTTKDVEFVKSALMAFRADHPTRQYKSIASDLNHDAGIVDTFLHTQDRPYSVSECLELVTEAGLVFQGWEDNYHYHPEAQIPRGNPAYDSVCRLPDRLVWQAVELFNGRIPKHSFFACRRDRDPGTYRIDFESDQFMDMVPIAHPSLTLTNKGEDVVVKRPPFPEMTLADADAAVVRNIDGRRSIQACLQASGAAAITESFGRDLFRTLWRLGHYRLVANSAIR